MPTCCALAGAIGLWLSAAIASAETPDDATLAAARSLGQQGVTLYAEGDYAGATDLLERAYAVVHVPTLGLWTGRALEKIGRLIEASQRYREVALIVVTANDPEVFRSAQADAQAAYDALGPRIPQVTLKLVGATANEVAVSIDGKTVPKPLLGYGQPVNPGTHKFEGRRGQDVQSHVLILHEGEKRAVELTFADVPSPKQLAARQSASNTRVDRAHARSKTSDDGSAGEPVTATWWFWTGLGSVVAAGTAVALAVALGNGDGGTERLFEGSAGSVRAP